MEMYRAVDATSVKSPACVFAPGDGWKRIEEELARTGLCLPFRHGLKWAVITAIQATGASSLRAVAAELNAREIPTARRLGEWSAVQVQRMLQR